MFYIASSIYSYIMDTHNVILFNTSMSRYYVYIQTQLIITYIQRCLMYQLKFYFYIPLWESAETFFQILANLCFLFSLKIAETKHEQVQFDKLHIKFNFSFKSSNLLRLKKKNKPNKKFNNRKRGKKPKPYIFYFGWEYIAQQENSWQLSC